MMEINIHNVEEIIFENEKIWKELPGLLNIKNQWKLGKIQPELRYLCKKSLLDFLNSVGEQDLQILSDFFNTKIVITKLDYNMVKNYEFDIHNLEENLNISKNEFFNYFLISRSEQKINITFWR